MANHLLELKELGQSVWLDYIRRDLMTAGELRRLIDEDGLAGVTANPSIFEKAIAGSNLYDADIAMAGGNDPASIYESLAIADVQMAADIFAGVYKATNGGDGYVSLEVPASLAYDASGSISDARRYARAVDRPNVYIKIPATEPGLTAIEESLAAGININITLIFSIERYLGVTEAYLKALERRAARGQPIDRLASVASFFVSRVDTLADKLIEKKLSQTSDPVLQATLRSLQGQVAIANSKVAYEQYQRIFSGERFKKLAAKGARTQRVLWASTSTKNPKYPDTYYVDELIGPDTVNTLPPETLKLFREHGHVRLSLTENVAGAHRVLEQLEAVGISREAIGRQLEEEGVKLFDDAFTKLVESIRSKAAQPAH
jgi:transaldolase